MVDCLKFEGDHDTSLYGPNFLVSHTHYLIINSAGLDGYECNVYNSASYIQNCCYYFHLSTHDIINIKMEPVSISNNKNQNNVLYNCNFGINDKRRSNVDGTFTLNLSKYHCYFALQSACCNCQDKKGFEFEVNFA